MRRVRWAYYYLFTLLGVAVLAGVIANDRPLLAYAEGSLLIPVLDHSLGRQAWEDQHLDWAIWPPIPFRAGEIDLSEATYQPPLTRNRTDGSMHWLGTDQWGRDLAAGLVSGARVAIIIGLGSVAVSLLIGLPLGAVAGYFGNHGLLQPRRNILAAAIGLPLGLAYAVGSLWYVARGALQFLALLLLSVVCGYCVLHLLLRLLGWGVPWLRRRVGVPVDRFVLLVLELTVSVPGLVLLIALLAYVNEPSLSLIVLVIGAVGWTPVARFLRAELMRVRELPYIAAARVGGVGEWRLLVRHALPNAIGPVIVVAAFMVGTSILAEAMLSFLGLGVPADEVTWGSILQQSRQYPQAWWLALFPGLLLTLTILACNSLRKRP